MSKVIYVQAQADYIASLSKGTPLSAIEELVWNALDAGAREVRIDLLTNSLGAAEALRISDDGEGIDVLRTESTFGGLGGSWKRFQERSISGRPLHGRHGCGRFKAFALGPIVEWRTTTRVGQDLLSYTIRGDIAKPGQFEIESAKGTGPATGTEVYISPVHENVDLLLNTEETVRGLSAHFALYLKSYPNVRIYFNGLPVTPLIVQLRTTKQILHLSTGAEAKLEIIEWKKKFVGAGRIILAGEDGFRLHELPSGVRSGNIPFTAYLVSPRFAALNAENALVLDELHPEVRAYLDAVKKALKTYFKVVAEDATAESIGQWIHEGSHPFGEDETAPDRKRFDSLALELSQKIESFSTMTPADHKIIFELLKRAMGTVPKGSLKDLLK